MPDGDVAAALAEWLRERGEPADVALRGRATAGLSQETWFVRVAERDAVLRLPTPSSGARAIRTQVAALRAVVGAVPAPAVLWHDDGEDNPFGRPFLVMEHVAGEVPVGWPALEPARREALAGAAVDVLADLHALPAPPPDGEPPTDLAFFERRLERFAPLPPVLGYGLWWLRRHAPPPPERTVLAHGDFRMGNLVVAGDRLAGVLDWEMAGPGDPLADLAWCFIAVWDEAAVDEPALVERYARRSGAPVDAERLRWHRVLAYVRLSYYALSGLTAFARGRSDDLRLAALRLQLPLHLERLTQVIEETAAPYRTPVGRCRTPAAVPRPPVTAADEAFAHPCEHDADAWAERTYHVLHAGDGIMVSAGRAVHARRGLRTAFGTVTDGGTLHAITASAALSDADADGAGPLHIEVIEPLRELRLVLEDPALPVGYDLTWRARTAPAATHPNRIEREGRVVTDYRNFFQSGVYSGTVRLGGSEHRVRERAGFRDRGWGLRAHEGAPGRGLVICGAFEGPGEALYVLLYESASGRRMFTDGWLLGPHGIISEVTAAEHDLELTAGDALLAGGRLALTLSCGARREVAFSVSARLYLRAAGYGREPGEVRDGYAAYDLADPAALSWLNGQNDNGCECTIDGVPGHGFVETGIGAHDRYRPQAAA